MFLLTANIEQSFKLSYKTAVLVDLLPAEQETDAVVRDFRSLAYTSPLATLASYLPSFYASPWWQSTNEVPQWLREYVAWHQGQKRALSADNWQSRKYLVVRCWHEDSKCGGTSDRLAFAPYILKVAHTHKRILLIHWERPARLEEYLQPPQDGIDWRLPGWLLEEFTAKTNYYKLSPKIISSSQERRLYNNTDTIVLSRHQTHDHGEHYYNEHLPAGEATFASVYPHAWKLLFQPSKPVQVMIDAELSSLDLQPGQYQSLHMRTRYRKNQENNHKMIEQAVHCSINKLQGKENAKVYIASDSSISLKYALSYGQSTYSQVSWTARNSSAADILHIDRSNFLKPGDVDKHNASDYYPVFVDLYLLALASCVTYGVGGYGKWASLISPYTGSCTMRYDKSTCPKVDTTDSAIRQASSIANEATQSNTTASTGETPLQISSVDTTPDLWSNSTVLPTWMKDYMSWHKEQRSLITPDNWRQFNFLIMRCLEKDKICGGTSDRIASVPLFLRLAHENKRILLIYWERPAPLESFLQPPPGGLDWRLPDWMARQITFGKKPLFWSTFQSRLIKYKRDPIADAVHQSFDHGQIYYDEHLEAGEAPFQQVYHDVWKTMFTPAPAVASLIEKEMQTSGLATNDYVAAHVRAKYMKNNELNANAVQNAINCASHLGKGQPIYIASDSQTVVQAAMNYGNKIGARVVARNDSSEPLHIDRSTFLEAGHDDWMNKTSADYYSIFVDLYVLANAKCSSVGVGGYGKWASMIGQDSSCYIRHTQHTCGWMDGNATEILA
jgi:hypothetical protein